MSKNIRQGAMPFVPDERSLPVLQAAVQRCRGCDLYRDATQAVFGELRIKQGARRPKVRIMLVGEQPGTQEDDKGKPFIGPAGKLLDRCLEEAGIDRDEVYVTNSVKHFKWSAGVKGRIGQKPTRGEVRACGPWLKAEVETVRPKLIVCLGSVAAQSLLGSNFKVTQSHGKVHDAEGFPPVMATLHPSAILRSRTAEDREHQTQMLINTLRKAAKA